MEVMRLNKQEKWYLVLGCLSALLIGGAHVASPIINAEIYDVSFSFLLSLLFPGFFIPSYVKIVLSHL